ncbi:MAG: phospholipid carrier-dependent glycosyltransferase [Actinobacteria bacterium]|nr:MAG: phospholipid carrier-dependent glycosyltransferase [Actinomycetota bacterium]
MSGRLARLRPHLPLALLVLAGLALRTLLMVAYRPAVLSNADSARFLHFAHYSNGLFEDHFGPSGYAAVLKAIRFFTTQFEATIALQHLMGVGTALLLYAAVRRLGAPRWAALVPAAVGLLSGDLMYLEHAPLSESPFLVLAAGGLYAAVRGLDRSGRWYLWLALGGALLAASSLFRNVGLILPPVVAIWALAATPGAVREKLIGAAAAAGGGAVVIGVYAALAALHGGTMGMSDVSGWNLYGKAAPFADCKQFTPPKGTRFLCQSSPSSARPASLYYLWFRGPARRRFGHPPNGNGTLGRFGRAAIFAQPLDYLADVARQLPRFVDPGAYHRLYSGGGPFSIGGRYAGTEAHVTSEIHRDYSAAKLHVGGFVRRMAEWQDTERAGGAVPAALAILALFGVVLARGDARRGALLFALAGAALVVLPAATLILIARYTIPPTPIVAAAAGVGAWAVVDRIAALARRA